MTAIWWRGEYMTAPGWMLLLYEWMLYDKWMTLWLLQDGCFSKMNECCLMNDEYISLHDEWIYNDEWLLNGKWMENDEWMMNEDKWMMNEDKWMMNERWMKDEWKMNEWWMKDEWMMNFYCMMNELPNKLTLLIITIVYKKCRE